MAFSYKFSHHNIRALLFSVLRSPCPIHIILSDVINQIITFEECILWPFLLRSVRQSHALLFLLRPNILRLKHNPTYIPVLCWHQYLDRDVNYMCRCNEMNAFHFFRYLYCPTFYVSNTLFSVTITKLLTYNFFFGCIATGKLGRRWLCFGLCIRLVWYDYAIIWQKCEG